MDGFRQDVYEEMNKGKSVLYRVQVGAFRNKKNAENYRDKLKQQGIECFIVEYKEG